MAKQLLEVISVECSAAGVAEHYGARSRGGLLDAWLIDSSDSAAVNRISDAGIACQAVPLWMTDPDATADMCQTAIDLAHRNA